MSATEHVLDEVARERLRQETLKAEGRFRHTCADRGMDDGEKLACLAEEFGEVAKAMLHSRMLVSDGGGDLREELIHVAAVAVAWAESIPSAAVRAKPSGPPQPDRSASLQVEELIVGGIDPPEYLSDADGEVCFIPSDEGESETQARARALAEGVNTMGMEADVVQMLPVPDHFIVHEDDPSWWSVREGTPGAVQFWRFRL